MLNNKDKELMIHLEKYHAITIKQANKIFYKSTFGYDVARKRLKQLEEMRLLQSYINEVTNEKVYFLDHKVSAHDLFVLDFYSLIHSYGCTNIEFIKEPRYLNNLIRPDGFLRFEFNGNIYFILLEVDLTHFTSMSKFQLYEKLFKEGTLQKQCYNTFPIILVAGFDNSIKYESQNFEVLYTDFKYSNICKLLEIA